METPEVIRQARVGLGLSQAELARELGVDTRQINRYETGATEPSLAVARRLADRLRISMDELAGAGTPFTGTWWSAWHGLVPEQVVTGPVELAQQGRRLTVQTPNREAADDVVIGITWRAEIFVDVDALLGWYIVDTPALKARGTLNLAYRNNALDGDWIKFSLSGSKVGQIALGRTESDALDRHAQMQHRSGG